MRKSSYFLFVLVLIAQVIAVKAQTTGTCNAGFTYTVNYTDIAFTPVDSNAYFQEWDFGDGQSYIYYYGQGYSKEVWHTYTPWRTYEVKHIVYDSVSGCRDSLTQSIYDDAHTNSNCQAIVWPENISYDPTFYWVGVTGSASDSFGRTYTWSINDSVLADTGQSFFYAFPDTGNYEVCAQLQTIRGCVSKDCKMVYIPSTNPCPSDVAYTYAADPDNPLSITFKPADNSSTLTYWWDFGDGTSEASEANPTHLYAAKGIYVSSFTAKNNVNNFTCNMLHQELIYVDILPDDTCCIDIAYVIDQNKVAFTALGSHASDPQHWAFVKIPDSNATSVMNQNNPTYIFPYTGYWWVYLSIYSVPGFTMQAQKLIYITAADSIAGNAILTYPNPATNEVHVDINLSMNNTIIANVFGVYGNKILTKQIAGSGGNNQVIIPVQNLATGIYYIEIKYGDKTKHGRFLKM